MTLMQEAYMAADLDRLSEEIKRLRAALDEITRTEKPGEMRQIARRALGEGTGDVT